METKGRPKLSSEQAAERVWTMVLDRLRREVDAASQEVVAQRIGRHPATIGRYLKGERGEAVKLRDGIHLFLSLGGQPMDLLRALGEEEVADLLSEMVQDEEFIKDLSRLIHDGRVEELKLIVKAMAKRTPN